MRIFQLIQLLVFTSGLVLGANANAAYPEKPIRIIVPFVAGGVSDNVARQVALKITEQTGKSFV